jgi:hypothetical protein
MNQSTCFGSPAVNPACPKIRVEQSGIGPSGTHLQASSKTQVTARPPTRANQPRHHGSIAYIPNTVGTSASGATGSTLSHFFSSRPTHEKSNLPMRTRDVVCRFLFALRPSYPCGSHSPIFSQTATRIFHFIPSQNSRFPDAKRISQVEF